MQQDPDPQIKIREHIEYINSSSTLTAQAFIDRGVGCRLTDLIFRPPLTFLKCIMLERQILRGASGIIVAVLNAYKEFVTYLKLWELQHVRDGGER